MATCRVVYRFHLNAYMTHTLLADLSMLVTVPSNFCHRLSGPVIMYTLIMPICHALYSPRSLGPSHLSEHLDVLFTSLLKALACSPPFLLPYRSCWCCQDKSMGQWEDFPYLSQPPLHIKGTYLDVTPSGQASPVPRVDIKVFSSHTLTHVLTYP